MKEFDYNTFVYSLELLSFSLGDTEEADGPGAHILQQCSMCDMFLPEVTNIGNQQTNVCRECCYCCRLFGQESETKVTMVLYQYLPQCESKSRGLSYNLAVKTLPHQTVRNLAVI